MTDKDLKDEVLDENSDQSYITVDGEDIPIQVLLEFEREENHKEFVFYNEINDEEDENEPKEFKVAEIRTMEDGSKELYEIDDEDDMKFCEDKFNEIVEEMESYSLGDNEEETKEEDEDEGESIIS